MAATVDQHRSGATVQAFFSREEWQDLSRIRPHRLVLTAAGTWVAILASLAAWAAVPHPAVFAIAFTIIATRQHALNTLVHEAAHYSITRRKALNDWISDIFFATPHLITTEGYRQKHLLHHSALGDPVLDTELKARYVIRGAGLLRHTVLSLCGVAAYRAMRDYAGTGAMHGSNWRYYALVALTNGALFAYCAALGAPAAYLWLWLLPLVTLTMYIATLRVLAEHQPEGYSAAAVEDFQRPLPPFTRSIPAGAFERFLFGPVNFCYHHEHHLAPGIPFANLPRMHALLAARGFYAPGDARVGGSYLGTLYRLVRPRQAPAFAPVRDRS